MINQARPLSVESIELPLSHIDRLSPIGPTFLFHLFSKLLGFNLKKFTLPEGLTGRSKIPSYTLQEFHNLPNGYYSVYFSKGYSVGFNSIMLGEMDRVRKELSNELSQCRRVLDLGCGDGSSTKALIDEGITEVWGIDPSPYLLVQAIKKNQHAKFIHAVAETTEFPNESFDGISACWVMHEVPAYICDLILKECFHILKPGGKLVIMEPSKHQFKKSYLQIFKQYGVKGLYYRFLAGIVHEPFLREWHAKEIKPWLENQGFDLVSNIVSLPEEKIVARKR